MRKLMWFTLGFAAVCGICCLLSLWFGLGTVMLMAAAAVIAAILTKKIVVNPVLLLAMGCAAGVAWFAVFSTVYLQTPSRLDEQVEFITIQATDYSCPTGYGTGVDGTVKLEGKTYFVRAYLVGEREVEPGEIVTGKFLMRYIVGDEGDTYQRSSGVFLRAYQEDEVLIAKGEPSFLAKATVLSEYIGERLEVFFPQDTAPFAKALLLGDTSELSYRQDTDLKLSGIRHIVAVSGLHVSILFALVSTLALKRRWLKAIIGIPVLLCFAAVAGFSPSVNRACIMCGMMLLSTLIKRDYDGPTALSFACLVMLLSNPMVILSAAFQLSVSCVAGIYLFRDPIQLKICSAMGDCSGKGLIPRLKRWLGGSVSMSISTMFFSVPVSAWYFGTVSLVGVLGNLLTLWVVSLAFCGTLGVVILSLISNGAALLLAKLVSIPIRYILFVAKLLGGLPVAAVFTQSVYVVLWLVFVYVLALIFWRKKKRSIVVLICYIAIGLCTALSISWLEPLAYDVQLTVLDVGHGQSIIIQWSDNTFLVDCGGDSDTRTADLAVQTLLSQGTFRLDGLILTHMDNDHAGGAEYLLQRMDAEWVILPEAPESQGFPGEMLPHMEGICFEEDGGKLTVFGPISAKGGNENSLCVLFESEKCAILITGDRGGFGERTLLRYAALPQVDVLIAGHHGSLNSTNRELLEAVRPEQVIISASKVDQRMIQRLEEYGCQVWRTDRDGTFIYRR